MARTHVVLSYTVVSLVLVLPACNGGGGGGGGGIFGGFAPPGPVAAFPEFEAPGTSGVNDVAANAQGLPPGGAGLGDLSVAGDVDFWSFPRDAGDVVSIELNATQLDQARWAGAPNVPRLTVWDVDGTTKLLEHDLLGAVSSGWVRPGGGHDLDIPRFLAPADGTYFVSVTQADQTTRGVRYTVAVKSVSVPIPQQVENEPAGVSGVNDDAASAQPIAPGSVYGWHVDDESDFYSFQVDEPSLVRCELVAYRNGVFGGDDSYYEPTLALYDPSGTVVLGGDDDTFFFDPAIAYKLTAPGTYFIEVAEFDFAGDGAYFLDLAVAPLGVDTDSPGDRRVDEREGNDTSATATVITYGQVGTGTTSAGDPDFFAFSGNAGDMVRVQIFDGDNSDTAAEDISVNFIGLDGTTVLPDDRGGGLQVTRTILRDTGLFYVRVNPPAGPTSYCFDLELVKAAAEEREPNNTLARATPLDANGRAAGVIDILGEVDVFSLTAQANELVSIGIFAAPGAQSNGFRDLSGHGSALQPVIGVFDAAGATLARTRFTGVVSGESITHGLATQSVSFVAPNSGTFFVAVGSAPTEASLEHYYIIERR